MRQEIVLTAMLIIVRVSLVTMFSIGYIASFQRIYADAQAATNGRRIFLRTLLMLFSTVLGYLMHYTATNVMYGDTALFYHNWGLFVILLPLFYPDFSIPEIIVQWGGVLAIWFGQHQDDLTNVWGLFALASTVLIIAFMQINAKHLMQHWLWSFSGFTIIGALFWLSTPSVGTTIVLSGGQRIWALSLFIIMVASVMRYWLHVFNAHVANTRLQELSTLDYDGTSHYQEYQAELTQLFTEAQVQGTPLTLVTLDFDHFKRINDEYGYLAGNAVLMGVTETILATLKDTNVRFRLSQSVGEELNLVLCNATGAAAVPIVQALQQVVRQKDYTYANNSMRVTISAGITEMRVDDQSIDRLYKRADDALYQSKSQGRDKVTFDDVVIREQDEMQPDYDQYQFFGQGIHQLGALAPQANYELLLRRFDAQLGRWVLPHSFDLPIPELIRLLQVIFATQLVSHVNLNLTAAQFQDVEVAQALTSFAQYENHLQELTIEITELASAEITRHISALYRAAGIKIFIDDVGSDNSFELVRNELSFVDGVKFAMQNLRKTNTDTQMGERIEFWLQVARENECAFILEGVESQTEIEMTKRLGIEYVQGYYFDKPHALVAGEEAKS